MTAAPDLVYIIHGSNAHTWWRRLANGGYPWWRRWSLFSYALRQAFENECEIREYRWSGHNSHQARLDAGADLAVEIEKESAARRVHLIGHSHGGNVALAAVNRLPPHRVASTVVLANPNMALVDGRGSPPEWLYWANAARRVSRIWNLYSPEDFVQTRLAEWFHGLTLDRQKTLLVRSTYGGADHKAVQDVEIHWARRLPAHGSMHSAAIGTVVGALLKGATLTQAMQAGGLAFSERNHVQDRGGWPGSDRVFEMIQAHADPAPFDLGNATGGVGILFVHGLTASPAEMRTMAQVVAQAAGWRCVGLLLPGHGTRIEDMQRASGKEWTVAVEHAYEELSRECNRVFLVGLSLGAVLACHLALRRAHDPKLGGLILLAPAFGVTTARTIGIHLVRIFHNLRNKSSRASDYFLDHELYSYLQIPLNRAAELIQLGREAAQNIGRLRDLPIMMFVGDRESTVSLEKILSVARENSWIRLVHLPRSRHILTVEPDKEMMFEASIRFMEECVGSGFAQKV